MRIADRESLEFRKQSAPPPSERYVCFSVLFTNVIIQYIKRGEPQALVLNV
jgi:hypothetical protein